MSSIELISDCGSGRAFVVVIDDASYLDLAQSIVSAIGERARGVLLRSAPITARDWRTQARDFEALLSGLKIRQASLVGIGAGATLAQNLALENPKMVRTLIIVDASLRPHPSVFERIVDRIESALPFGLPLRLGSEKFNVRAFAHRLRCPTMLVSTGRCSSFVSNELRDLGVVAPTAWYRDLTASNISDEGKEVCELVLAFHETPAKCPQKNLQEAV